MRRALTLILASLALLPASAEAADPGLWIKTSQLTKPAWYRQGLASNPLTGDVFFSGSFAGLYRTRNEAERQRMSAVDRAQTARRCRDRNLQAFGKLQ